MPKPIRNRAVFSALAVLFGFVFSFSLINEHSFARENNLAIQPTVANIGSQMLNTSEHGFVLPFEVVSILLLAAMIGCIVIAIKTRPA